MLLLYIWQIFMISASIFYDFSYKWTDTPGIGIHLTKAWLSQLVNFKNAIWTWGHFRRTIRNKISVLNSEKMPQKRTQCYRLLFDHLVWIEHHFLTGIRDSRKAGSLWGMMRGMGGVRKSIDESGLAKGLGLGLLCWGFKGVQEEIPSEEASTLQIWSVAFPPGQYTSPQLNPFYSLFDQYLVHTLLLVTFGYSLSSEAVVIWQLRRWKRLWRRSSTHSHQRTSMWLSRGCWNGTTSVLQPEEIISKGLEFHVCTINKSAHTKKVLKPI